MSSHSYGHECPNCNKEMNANTDNKPFDQSSGECPYCGFAYYTKTYQMDLEELNEIRADQLEYCNEEQKKDLQPLKKLPEMNKDLITNY